MLILSASVMGINIRCGWGCKTQGVKAPSIIVRPINLETDMTLFSPTISYPPISMHDRPNSPDVASAVWASIVVIGLAIAAVALGIASVVDPAVLLLS